MRFQKWMGIGVCASVLGGVLGNGGLRVQADLLDEEGNSVSRTGDRGIQEPRQKLTRDAAAKSFSVLMNDFAQNQNSPSVYYALASAISRKSEQELGNKQIGFVQLMASQWRQRSQTVSVQSEGDKTATVLVEESAIPVPRPLVLVEENGGWGVDLIETYAKWNNLEGSAKAETIFKLTGVITEGMPRTEEFRRSSCQSNLKQVALGIAQYVQDYDEKLPPAKKWIDVLQPYVRSEQIFKCPSLSDPKGYGYAYNSKLSTKPQAVVETSALTVSIYETNVISRNVYGTGENLAFRHLNGANYAFADGHVKWLLSSTKPSFNLKQ